MEPYLGLADHIIGVIPAGRNRVYTGEYKKSRLAEIGFQVRSVSDVISCSMSGVIYCGEGVSSIIDAEHIDKILTLVGCEGPSRRASFLAKLGFGRIESGDTDDPQSLEPIYVRSAQITSAENSKRN